MARNSEDYDFFGDDQYDDSLSPRRGNRGSRRGPSKVKATSPTSRRLSRCALVAGLLAVLASANCAVHEIAPYAVPFMSGVRGRYIAAAAAILVALALALVVAARVTMPRRSTHGGVGAGGIISLVLAIVLLVVGVTVGVLFPQGLVQAPVNDKAPVDNTAQMKQGIEQAAGACTDGWQGLDTDGMPGILTIEMCTNPRVAFVSFDSEAAAAVGRAPIESKISSLLAQYADDEQAQGDWRLLNGGRWMVFGEADKMTALQQQWGGDLDTIEAAAIDDAAE